MLKRILPIVIVLVWFQPASSRGAPSFADYLSNIGLQRLQRVELHRRCLEDNDITSCLEYADILGRYGNISTFVDWVDSIGVPSSDIEATKLILRAKVSLSRGEYGKAFEYAQGALELLPSMRLLVEAILVRAKAAYEMGELDVMKGDVEALAQYLEATRRPDFALLEALAKEDDGDLDRSQQLMKVAFRRGIAEAAPEVLRLAIKRDDLETFLSYLDSVPSCEDELVVRKLSDLSTMLVDLLPQAWEAIVARLANDSTFNIDSHPEIVSQLVDEAEMGLRLDTYATTFLRRSRSPYLTLNLRYVRAVSLGSVDSLFVLMNSSSDWHTRTRCALAILEMADTSQPASAIAADEVTRQMALHADEIPKIEIFAAIKLLVERLGKKAKVQALETILDRLEETSEPVALLNVAGLERQVARQRAQKLYRRIALAVIPTRETLEAEKALWELKTQEHDTTGIASDLEELISKGGDPFELGNLLFEKLGAYDRAIAHYRRALKQTKQSSRRDSIKMRLAEALIRSGASASSTLSKEMRREIAKLLKELAVSNSAQVRSIILLTKAATVFSRQDYELASEVANLLKKRSNLTPHEMYEIYRLAYYLFLLAKPNASDLCSELTDRLQRTYPDSSEAGLSMLLDARIKFFMGDYVGALKRYQVCLRRWRQLESLCNHGIAECYLYSGGFLKALSYLKASDQGVRVLMEIGKCHEILDQTDSARVYLERACRTFSLDPFVTITANSTLGLLVLKGGGSLSDLSFLNPRVFSLDRGALRELRTIRRMLQAYYLAKQGYRFAERILRLELSGDQRIACLSRLCAAEAIVAHDADIALQTLPHLGQCLDIFNLFRVMKRSAEYACLLDSIGTCEARLSEFAKRFPLASQAIDDLKNGLILCVFRNGKGAQAVTLADSLARDGYSLSPEVVYREGIEFMLNRRYRDAIATFMGLVEKGAESHLYYDACFKLGTAYYMSEVYDSSAYYFSLASRAPQVGLVREALFNGGLAKVEAGDNAGAFDLFWAYAIRFPLGKHFERALMRAAFALEETGNHDRAIGIYRQLRGYATASEVAAEATYWVGQAYSLKGSHLRSALEYLRIGYLWPEAEKWAGTASFEAGIECEKAGLIPEAVLIYKQTVKTYGRNSHWGKASFERLKKLGSQD